MKPLFIIVFVSIVFLGKLFAQQDPEFPKGFIMYAKLHNGLVTNFKDDVPDLYVGGIQLVPMVTLVEHKLRGGLIVDGFYTGKKIQAAAGPTIAWKIKTINAGVFGSAANINLSFDHLWGTEDQRLVGGGINADLLNFLLLGITAHRDYQLNTWWLQSSIGLRISKKKKVVEPF
ncbi:MAG: hypothetical protein V4717_12765 [Bacteroidota bacterium]